VNKKYVKQRAILNWKTKVKFKFKYLLPVSFEISLKNDYIVYIIIFRHETK